MKMSANALLHITPGRLASIVAPAAVSSTVYTAGLNAVQRSGGSAPTESSRGQGCQVLVAKKCPTLF